MVMEIKIHHKDGEFFVEINGKKAVLDYRINKSEMDIFHTFTDQELRGQGLAEKLTLAAFEYAKKNSLVVVPSCSYVRDYFLPKYREFQDIVVDR